MKVQDTLYSAAQVRELDRRAIHEQGIASGELMARAGAAVYLALRARYPRARRLAVVCGPGNNGGDGYVVARLAKQDGLEPTVYALGDPARASAEAAAARRHAVAAGVTVQPFGAPPLRTDVIVDALLGIGLERAVQNEWRAAIDAMNQSGAPIVAVDIPSGLHADSGAVMGTAVRAHVSVCFIGYKIGLFTGAGREQAGEILFDDLGVPREAYRDVVPLARRITLDDLGGLVPRRVRDAHKGLFGQVLVVGGGRGMIGAARLSGEAAYRAGAGLVSLAVHPTHSGFADRPELIAHAVQSVKDLKPLLANASVVALGPGLSQDAWARRLFTAALASKRPLVVDADGLNLLARRPAKRRDWVLTPHPGEAARLLKTNASEIQRDRRAAAHAIVKRYGGVCVLKGSGTLVVDENATWLCDAGNPGMASGGSGDVLTGVIAALRAQGLGALDAARFGVWLHATAADRVAQRDGEIGLLARDVIPLVREELNRMAR